MKATLQCCCDRFSLCFMSPPQRSQQRHIQKQQPTIGINNTNNIPTPNVMMIGSSYSLMSWNEQQKCIIRIFLASQYPPLTGMDSNDQMFLPSDQTFKPSIKSGHFSLRSDNDHRADNSLEYFQPSQQIYS